MSRPRGCVICTAPVPPRSRGETCSYSCRARLREQRKTVEWRKPRDYPEHIVRLACDLYQSGMTVAEIRAVFPAGYKVQRILERHLSARRPTAKRDQWGERNHMWRAANATYEALHLRVISRRGRPGLCQICSTTEGRFEWSNISGDYWNVDDYWRLCVPCHRLYDARRRRETGALTVPPELRGGVA